MRRMATNRLAPSGGVRNPISQQSTNMIPKCTGSTPTFLTTGRRTGVSRMIWAMLSIHMPMKMRTAQTIARMTYRLSERLPIHAAISCGILFRVMIWPKI